MNASWANSVLANSCAAHWIGADCREEKEGRRHAETCVGGWVGLIGFKSEGVGGRAGGRAAVDRRQLKQQSGGDSSASQSQGKARQGKARHGKSLPKPASQPVRSTSTRLLFCMTIRLDPQQRLTRWKKAETSSPNSPWPSSTTKSSDAVCGSSALQICARGVGSFVLDLRRELSRHRYLTITINPSGGEGRKPALGSFGRAPINFDQRTRTARQTNRQTNKQTNKHTHK